MKLSRTDDGGTKDGRSPHGERGLKFAGGGYGDVQGVRRSPHGERGLKWKQIVNRSKFAASLSSRRAWIEITTADATAT